MRTKIIDWYWKLKIIFDKSSYEKKMINSNKML